MTLKFDMLFHYSSNALGDSPDAIRTAGWSEGWYTDNPITIARANAKFLCQARASLMPVNCSIIGQRYRTVGGGSTTDNQRFPGIQSLNGDFPSLSVLATCKGTGVPNIRRFELRGLADGRVENGEFIPSQQYTAGFTWFGDLLARDGWKFKGRVLTNVKVDILTITDAGLVTLFGALDVTAGDLVRFLNVKGENGESRSGVYKVGTVLNPGQWNILNWQGGDTEGGFVRAEESDYFSVEAKSLTRGRVVTRKVGRGFFQFRGRASNRR